MSVPRIFKIAMTTSCGESINKVAFEISTFQLCQKLYHSIIVMCPKVVLLEISKNSLDSVQEHY